MFREYRAWDVGIEGYQMFDLVLTGRVGWESNSSVFRGMASLGCLSRSSLCL